MVLFVYFFLKRCHKQTCFSSVPTIYGFDSGEICYPVNCNIYRHVKITNLARPAPFRIKKNTTLDLPSRTLFCCLHLYLRPGGNFPPRTHGWLAPRKSHCTVCADTVSRLRPPVRGRRAHCYKKGKPPVSASCNNSASKTLQVVSRQYGHQFSYPHGESTTRPESREFIYTYIFF